MTIIRTIIATMIAATIGMAGATSAHAEDARPTGSPYAFAVQPHGCEAGYVNLNYAEGIEYRIDGGPAEDVQAPATRVHFDGGLQAEVTATALDGYVIAPGETTSFYLTVNPTGRDCGAPDPAPVPRREACEEEDSRNCVWDALHRGNGIGDSFKSSPRGRITYLTHKRAHFLLTGIRVSE